MQDISFDEALDTLCGRDPRYNRDAYVFVREALDYTQKAIAKQTRGRMRHVSGQELLSGIREYVLEQFGPMAITVLQEWGITHCRDFGEIVFNMVEIGLLAKTDKDSQADFDSGYDFFEAFRAPFLPPSKRASSETIPAPSIGAD